MTDKQIIDSISNFCLTCYYDNKTNELVHIEQYNDNDTSIYSDIESYKYGYNAEIVKPEQLIRQLKIKENECEKLKRQIKRLKAELKNTSIQKIDWDELIKKYEQFRYSQLSLKEQLNKQSEFYESVLKDIECMLNSYSDTEELIKELKHLLHIVLHERN